MHLCLIFQILCKEFAITVTTKFPNLKFIGLCHEIASMERQLPDLMKTEFSNINFRAGGLNHFSILLNVNYKDTGEDGYPMIRKNFENYYSNLVNDHEGFVSKPGAEEVYLKNYLKNMNIYLLQLTVI